MDTPKTSYMRSLPFRSPDDLAAQTERLKNYSEKLAQQSAQLWRWTYGLAAAGFAVLVLVVAAVVIFLNQGRSAPPAAAPPAPVADAAPANAPKNVTELAPSKEKKETPPVSPKVEPAPAPAKVDSPPAPEPAPPSPPAVVKKPLPAPKETKSPAKSGATITAAQKESFLEALGGLSAAHLYQSYLNIGLLADGVDAKAYTLDEAKGTLAAILNFMDLVEAKLTKLDRAALDADDQEALDRIKTATDLLRVQATALLAYWNAGTKEKADDYHQARKAASAGLNKVLGLEAK